MNSLLLRSQTRRVLLAALTLVPAASAQTPFCPEGPVLQHNTGSNRVAQAGFLAGDEWGAVFGSEIPAAHYPIEITRVAFELGPTSGPDVVIAHDSLRIYPAGLPDPGVAQFVLPSATLFANSGTLLSLEILPNAPGQDRVIQQGPFTVTYRLLVDAGNPLGAPPVHDGNGCQAGKNVWFTASGPNSGWSDACSLGVAGDWRVAVFYRRLNCLDDGPGVTYCAGNGDWLSCSVCTCNNQSPLGSPGGCLNSEMRSAELFAAGEASLTNDTLQFTASGATSMNFGILVSADNRLPNDASFCPDGSGLFDPLLDGIRCVGGAALRHGTRLSNDAGEFGVTTPGWGLPDPPAGGILASSGFVAGQVRHFQLFYRDDPAANCGTGNNTSNAISIPFTP